MSNGKLMAREALKFIDGPGSSATVTRCWRKLRLTRSRVRELNKRIHNFQGNDRAVYNESVAAAEVLCDILKHEYKGSALWWMQAVDGAIDHGMSDNGYNLPDDEL